MVGLWIYNVTYLSLDKEFQVWECNSIAEYLPGEPNGFITTRSKLESSGKREPQKMSPPRWSMGKPVEVFSGLIIVVGGPKSLW